MGPRAGLDGCEKSRPPTGIRSPDRPALSESLYRLRSPGPYTYDKVIILERAGSRSSRFYPSRRVLWESTVRLESVSPSS